MLKIENTEVYGWGAAIRGMRNPLNSWDKIDSYDGSTCLDEVDFNEAKSEGCIPKEAVYTMDFVKNGCSFVVGENDLKLMKNLSKAGNDHAKFLRYLIVQVDITAPLYWWKEFKTYRKGRKFMDDGDEFLDPEEFEMFIETNSCSTMHKIHEKEFTMEDFSFEHLTEGSLNSVARPIVSVLNNIREAYLNYEEWTKIDPDSWEDGINCKKDLWWQLIQLLPSSYNQKRTVQLNYQVLKQMYFARRNHKLDEWHTFCEWCEALPYFREICIQE